MAGINLPLAFVRTTIDVHGEQGAAWLQALPALLETCAARWGLTLAAPFSLSYNYVVPARQRDGSRVVLKLGVPCRDLLAEMAALQHFAGHGCVRLLDDDAEAGALLLERLEPGTSLETSVDDEAATHIAAEVMRVLWKPAPAEYPFSEVADWLEAFERLRSAFDGGTGPLPSKLVDRTEALAGELLRSADTAVLLHGDLHHWNILQASRAPWLAIDPKGVIGEPAFEIGAFLLNPTPQPENVLARRVEFFAEVLGLERERIRGWGLVRAVLSACWTVEDHGAGWDEAMAVAERLLALSTS